MTSKLYGADSIKEAGPGTHRLRVYLGKDPATEERCQKDRRGGAEIIPT
jgi:hypothetical protein